uniref:Kinesin motor domain-containing protein n=1 Tax=Macrostomum lignano TaxID=282301 RepID=A0A1I8FV39_9PLAT
MADAAAPRPPPAAAAGARFHLANFAALLLAPIGTNVDIQRTDGRIHSAIVSGINRDSHSVTVEWFERGEAKGKEIELEAIFQLNPGLAPADGGGGGGGGGANIGGGGSIDYGVNGGGGGNASEASVGASFSHREPAGPAGSATTSSSGGAGGRVQKVGQQPFLALEVPPKQQQPAARYAPPPPPVEPQDSIDEDDYGGQAETSPTREERGAARRGGRWRGGGGAAAGGGAGGGAAAGGGRKSNVVKEIERIQQRRDERRAAQQAKKSDPDYDPSNPQFEFLQMIREFQSTLDYRPITNDTPIEIHQICVCVRKRPLNKKELTKKEIDVVDLTKYLENQQFRFDYAFDQRIDNLVVYNAYSKAAWQLASPTARLDRGKTHTMGGDFTGKGQQDCARGIYALAARDVFKLLNSKYKGQGLGKVFDLLNKKAKLRVLEDGKNIVQIVGLLEERVNNVEEVLGPAESRPRHSDVRPDLGQSAQLPVSRRVQLILRKGQPGGAERHINKSLLALKECIGRLGVRARILPFSRIQAHPGASGDSCFIVGRKARSHLLMIATISPGFSSCEAHAEHTPWRYADRVKELGPELGPISGAGAGGEPGPPPPAETTSSSF